MSSWIITKTGRLAMIGNIHLKQSFKGIGFKLLLLCIVLFLFQMLFTVLRISPSIQQNVVKNLDQIPDFVQKMMGEGFIESLLKYGLITAGYLHPFMLIIFILFIFLAISQVVITEIDNGTIGFTLSKSLSRTRIYLNLGIIIYIGIACLALSAFLSTSVGIMLFHVGKISQAPFASIAWNLFILMIFVTGYVIILASVTDSGKSFYLYGGSILFFFYLLSFATRLWKPLQYISPLSPFSYYKPMQLLMGRRIDFSTSFWILVVSLIMFGVAILLFNRRNIASG
jgi:beta-exotoxin I transport system permease protein